MEQKWSNEEIGRLIEIACKAQTGLLLGRESYQDTRKAFQDALRTAYDAGLSMNSERLRSAHEAMDSTSRLCDGAKAAIAQYEVVLETVMRALSTRMTTEDYKTLCRHDLATYLLKKLPQYPTGEIYQISWPMTLETAAFHARNHWDQSGCHYTSCAHYGGDEIYVTVVGTPRALLLWVCEEFDNLDDILKNFHVCDDPALIRHYISQHRTVVDPTEELEEKLGTS
jgi:hypothetical protein